ncbi:MAG: OmpA family protein, partial [Paludibacteraceae bacterium]|nr:OmpA family protein [Paludibacteraceae bacterium]
HPNWSIEVRGHCCDLGTERANNKIGLERANEAKKYLVKQGVDESRITVTSMGSTQPLVPNDSPEHRAQNRRVEIVINK